MKTIALLGQPNSGKSTLYNALTGGHQRVGNWPGKTVEKAEGDFFYKEQLFRIADLPGSYGLTANSEEEVVTRDFIERGNADLVCLIVDASQLERSLFMLADFAGIQCPAMLVLNMMDVAKENGKTVNASKIEQALGIPVLGFTASDPEEYPKFYETLERAVESPKILSAEGIRKLSENAENSPVKHLEALLQGYQFGIRENFWIASKLLENDPLVSAEVRSAVDADRLVKMERMLKDESSAGGLITGEAKYRWISEILQGSVTEKKSSVSLSRFDKMATHRILGKILAFGIMLVTLIACMALAMPGMFVGFGLMSASGPVLHSVCESLGVWPVIESFVKGVLIGGLGLTLCMTSFVFAIVFMFALVENIGYMARFSYVFDSWLSRLGLHGKAIMPLFSGLACTAGAACGTRVLDTRGQRLFAMVLLWGIPCGAKLGVVLFLASAFFGSMSMLFALIYVSLIFASFYLSSKLFGGKLMPVEDRVGMIMELPPYHKPQWKALFKMVGRNTWSVFKKALVIIVCASFLFWALSYSSDGNVENTILYSIGNAIEPVTKLFGMRWQLFVSYLGGVFSKEASLGIMSTIFGSTDTAFSLIARDEAGSNLAEVLNSAISKPEALAFVFASMFNVPCVLAMGSTYREANSLKWLLAIMGYYFAISLGLAFVAYHIGLLIF